MVNSYHRDIMERVYYERIEQESTATSYLNSNACLCPDSVGAYIYFLKVYYGDIV